MYEVIVERSAEKDLKKLSSEVRPRAVAAMLALGNNPRPTGSRKFVASEND
jgi:mRNA interferase RelE/StbE